MEKRTSASERIGRNVRRIRQHRGETLAQLSATLDGLDWPLSVGKLSKLELGDRGVDAGDLEMLAEALGVPIAQLLAEDQEVSTRVEALVRQLVDISREEDRALDELAAARDRGAEVRAALEEERRARPESFANTIRHSSVRAAAVAVNIADGSGRLRKEWQ